MYICIHVNNRLKTNTHMTYMMHIFVSLIHVAIYAKLFFDVLISIKNTLRKIIYFHIKVESGFDTNIVKF